MASESERVVIELLAKVDGFDGKVRASASAFGGAMKQVERSATTAEKAVQERLAKAYQAADIAISNLAKAQAEAAGEINAAKAAYKAGETSLGQYNQSILQTKAALSLVEAEHRKAVTEFQRASGASAGVTRAFGAAQNASRNLGYQISDISTQLAGGTSPFLILAQQGPQVANALEGASGAVGRMATFLSSWQGALILAAGTLAAQFIPKLLESGDALDKEIEKLKKNAEEAEVTRKAKEQFGKTEEGVTEAILEQKDALDKQDESLRSEAERARDAAKANLQHELSIRAATRALLDQALVQEQIANKNLSNAGRESITGGEAEFGAAQGASKRVAALQAKINDQDSKIRIAEANLARAQSHVDVEAGNRDADPVELIKHKYEGPNGLIELARKRLLAEGKVGDALERQVAALKKQEQVEIDRESKKRRASTDTADLTPFISPVDGGRVTGKFGDARPGHTHAGIDIAVPVGTPVKAPAAGVIIEAGVVPGYGNVVYIDHGRGTISRLGHLSHIGVTKGQVVGQGDIIGKSGGAKGAPGSGDSTGPHLHQEVRVNGRAVDPRKGPFNTDQGALAEKAAAAAKEELQRRQAFANELATLQGGELEARQALIAAAEEIAQLEIQSIEVARKKYDDNLDALVAQGKLHADEAKQLRDINDERAKLRTELVQRREDERKFRMQEAVAQEKLQFQSDSYAVEEELVRSQEGVAKTAKERQRLGQRLIDLQFDEERIQNDAIIAEAARLQVFTDHLKTERQLNRDEEIARLEAIKLQGQLNEEQTKRLDQLKNHPAPLLSGEEQQSLDKARDRATTAQGRNDTLDQRKANAQQGNAEQNASPIQHWMDEVPQKADEINQAFENIAAGGLTTFADGLADAIVNFKSLGDVARAVIQSMLSDLIKLIAKMLIVKALKAIFGGFADGGAVGKGFNSDKGVKFASGGPVGFPTGGLVMGDGTATSDSIPARLSNGEFVIRKKAVDGLGLPFLNQINQTGRLPMGFAGGGALQAVRPNNTPAAAPGSAGAATLSPEAVRQLEGVVTRAAAAMPDIKLYPTLSPGAALEAGLSDPTGRRAMFDFHGANSNRLKKAQS